MAPAAFLRRFVGDYDIADTLATRRRLGALRSRHLRCYFEAGIVMVSIAMSMRIRSAAGICYSRRNFSSISGSPSAVTSPRRFDDCPFELSALLLISRMPQLIGFELRQLGGAPRRRSLGRTSPRVADATALRASPGMICVARLMSFTIIDCQPLASAPILAP